MCVVLLSDSDREAILTRRQRIIILDKLIAELKEEDPTTIEEINLIFALKLAVSMLVNEVLEIDKTAPRMVL